MELTPQQAEELRAKLMPQLNYLGRVRRRMSEVGFVTGDETTQAIDQAFDAMHQLCVRLHYLACGRSGNSATVSAPFAHRFYCFALSARTAPIFGH